ncbi:NACHT, LRR and PYD domains-containing protein 3-like [Pristis pectinata]|uniref:NACHT, LRR and PYD domains-containing protein 3-like n=1 Tax=Pristis pectinata TaxID=685728 RepID=UPI00223CEBFE|nr:NACHT, LRR and PYD domains-containing protein 3-like [Pristis pectinata]
MWRRLKRHWPFGCSATQHEITTGCTPPKRSCGQEADQKPSISDLVSIWGEDELLQLTQFFRDRLEQAAEDGVAGLSSMLKEQRRFSAEEHLKLTDLAEKGKRKECSKEFLDLVMKKGSWARKVMWESFVKMPNKSPKLDKILKEIQELGPGVFECMNNAQELPQLPSELKDLQRKHKEILRAETETLKMETVLEEGKGFKLADRYRELTVVSSLRDRRLVEPELMARGRDHEEWREKHLREELEKLRTDQLFRSGFSLSRITIGSSAGLFGVPGIGKTTMVQKIVYDWATGKIFQHFQFVFSFTFRDLNKIKDKISLKELILGQYRYLENTLVEVWKNPEVLLFVFDGLDEFKDRIDFTDRRRNTRPQQVCTDPERWYDVSDIVYSLIQHKLLPGCSVLVTTRPTALHLLEKAEISVWAEILGFAGEHRKEYFNRYFEDESVGAAVFKHVQENEILYTMSYNPSYCSMINESLGPIDIKRDNKWCCTPNTITQTYSHYIYNILKNHGREIENPNDVFQMIGNMAFAGVSEKKVVFTADDLIKYDLKPSQFLSGLLMELLEREDSARSVVYTFPHLTIQEFVAALAQFLRSDPSDIKKILTEAQLEEDGRFELFLRFLVGLSYNRSPWLLEEFMGPFPDQTARQVNDWVREEIKRQIGNTARESGKRKLLNTLQYVTESQDGKLAQATLGSAETLSFSELPLTPIDCAVLSHAIVLCDAIKHLDMESCYIRHEGLQRLGPGLQKCQELGLGRNQLGDSGVKLLSEAVMKPGCQIQTLRLVMNDLTDYCAEDLVSILTSSCTLKELDLSDNALGDSGVKVLSKALKNPNCKILKLRLRANGLTAACAADLSSALAANQWLEELELGNNDLQDAGVRLLSAALTNPESKIRTLDLCCNGLTASSAKDLAFAVGRKFSLTELNLGDNELGDSAAKLVSAVTTESDHKIKTLWLFKTGLTDSCTGDLVSILSTMPSLMYVNLKYNSFTDRSIPSLRRLIINHQNLKCIGLEGNQFSSDGRNQLKSLQKSRPGLSVEL